MLTAAIQSRSREDLSAAVALATQLRLRSPQVRKPPPSPPPQERAAGRRWWWCVHARACVCVFWFAGSVLFVFVFV